MSHEGCCGYTPSKVSLNEDLLNQGNCDSDPLPKEDEEADDNEEEDPNDGGEGQPSVLLLQEVIYDLWRPVQLQKSVSKVKKKMV